MHKSQSTLTTINNNVQLYVLQLPIYKTKPQVSEESKAHVHGKKIYTL